MRPAFLILPGILLTLSACGRGGVTLDTDNVKGEWFPDGGSTTIVLDHETAPVEEVQREDSGIMLTYDSTGTGEGMLSVNGAPPEPASVTREKEKSPGAFHFKTSSREIRISGVRRISGDSSMGVLDGWSYQEQGATWPRSGTAGSMTTEYTGQ